MPTVKEGESEKDFVSRCIPVVLKEGTAKDQSQAAAICHSMYRNKDKKEESSEYIEFTFDAELILEERELPPANADEFEDVSEGEAGPKTEKTWTVVAATGDKIKKGTFMPASTLEASVDKWEGTLHDINHMGTTHSMLDPRSDIRFFVGYHDNVSYDAESKSLRMRLTVDENTMYGNTWKSFVNLCSKAGKVPNVSVSVLGRVKYMKAKDLPEGVDASEYGEEEMVPYFEEIIPRAVSTVLQGAWSEKDGCGIVNNSSSESSEVEDEKADQEKLERQKLIDELKKLDDEE